VRKRNPKVGGQSANFDINNGGTLSNDHLITLV